MARATYSYLFVRFHFRFLLSIIINGRLSVMMVIINIRSEASLESLCGIIKLILNYSLIVTPCTHLLM